MKKLFTKSVLLFLITISCSSCAIDMMDKVIGNKNVVTENRKLSSDFTAIKASNGLEVYITQNGKNGVTVEADENLQSIIKTDVENGVLKIYTEKNIWRASSKKIFVSAETITSMKASSGANIQTKETIYTDEISIVASSGAAIKATIDAKNTETQTSSGANINIVGKTDNHASKASSGSQINASNFTSKNAIAKVSSGAQIEIHATSILEAKASSGGSIDYKGNPEKINKTTSSGGSISKT